MVLADQEQLKSLFFRKSLKGWYSLSNKYQSQKSWTLVNYWLSDASSLVQIVKKRLTVQTWFSHGIF